MGSLAEPSQASARASVTTASPTSSLSSTVASLPFTPLPAVLSMDIEPLSSSAELQPGKVPRSKAQGSESPPEPLHSGKARYTLHGQRHDSDLEQLVHGDSHSGDALSEATG